MGILASNLRRLARLPLLRRLRRTRFFDRLADALDHGRIVRQTPLFVVREMLPRERTSTYRPRGARLAVVLRHHTSDRFILAQLFRERLYALPDEPLQRLLAIDQPKVVDVGAHVGLFGAWFLSEYPAANVVAFEPDPGNAAVLRRCIEQNRLADQWTVIEACAGTAGGTVPFRAGQYAESQIGDGPGSGPVPVRDVFPHLADADVVKLDAEGAEWAILTDPRFRELTPPLIALEYHPQGCPGSDPRKTALSLLEGYDVAEIEVPHAPSGVGMLMAWRTASPSHSSWQSGGNAGLTQLPPRSVE
jgi:FkbM family methyltransferase